MEFSLFYFANDSSEADEGGRYQLLIEGARFADANGFAAVWTPERHFHPFGGLYPNPAVTSAAVAAVTSRVAIRAGSVVAPLHHPMRIAEDWSVVDNLSGGRGGVAVARVWPRRTFGWRREGRGAGRELLTETLELVRRLWRGEAFDAVDGKGQPVSLKVYPPAVQAELPCWITSAGSVETFRTAGHLGAGLLSPPLGHALHQPTHQIPAHPEAHREHPTAARPPRSLAPSAPTLF